MDLHPQLSDRVALAFLERYETDRARGLRQPLSCYLEAFPESQVTVAREFLAAEARGDHNGDELECSPPAPSERLGPYEIKERLGQGGQGTVFLAEDTRFGRRVALKILRDLGPQIQTQLQRFRREAEIASRLEHPHICGVHDAGIDAGVPYIAMPYLEGETLDRCISRSRSDSPAGPSFVQLQFGEGTGETDDSVSTVVERSAHTAMTRQDLAGILTVFEKVGRALDTAHQAGVLHRDIKPQNIMILRNGEPVIMDFGLARLEEGEQQTLTRTGDVFGTPSYMSPEQISGKHAKLDRRTDIYSLGVTLFECLTLQKPHEAPTRQALYHAILTTDAPDSRKVNRAIPADLKIVIETALEKIPDQRYQTAEEFANELRRVREHEPIVAQSVSLAGRVLRWARRSPSRAALVALLAIAVPLIAWLGGYVVAMRPDVRAQEEARIRDRLDHLLDEGYMELHFGKPELAVTRFKRALEAVPSSGEALGGLALAYLELGQPLKAQWVFDERREILKNTPVYDLIRADILEALKRFEDAAALRQEKRQPQSPLEAFLIGVRALSSADRPGKTIQYARKELDSARALFLRAILASDQKRRVYHLQLAHAVGRLGSVVDPGPVASALNRLWPKSAMAWFWSGYAWRDADPERAAGAWHQALLLDPDLYQAHYNLGNWLMKTGALDQALEAYSATVLLRPEHAHAWNEMGIVLKAQGQIERATEAWKQAVTHDPESHLFLNNLGSAFYDREEWKEALACFQLLIAMKPEFTAGHIQLAWTLIKTKDINKALERSRLALEIDPDNPHALRVLGMAQLWNRQTEQALETWRKALRLKPDFYDAHRNIADVLFKLGRIEKALPFFENAARHAPPERKAVALFNLGNVYQKLGRVETAVATWGKAIDADPGYHKPYLQIGVTHLKDGFIEDAIAMLQQAWALDHEYVHTSRALGKAYFLAERWADAIGVWKAELKLRPGQPQVLYSMGLAYRKLEKIDKAIETWRQLLKATPNHRGALEALEELEREGRAPR